MGCSHCAATFIHKPIAMASNSSFVVRSIMATPSVCARANPMLHAHIVIPIKGFS